MRTRDLDEVLQDEVRVVGPALPVVITPVLIDALAVDPHVARLGCVEVLVALVHREEVLRVMSLPTIMLSHTGAWR